MKFRTSAPAPRLLAQALGGRAFLDRLDRRMSALGPELETQANRITGGNPPFRAVRRGAGLRVEPADKAAAERLEYGSLRVAPHPWAARLIIGLRAFAARLGARR